MFTADGRRIGSTAVIPGCREWIWWGNDVLRATTQRDRQSGTFSVIKYQDKSVLANGLQGAVMMIADMSGDWREEIVTMLPGELRVYSTTISARDRRVSLIQDPLYRNYIAHRSMGYDQPPMTSYYIGVDPADAPEYTPLIQPVTK
jgi:rhamnogalacturonan endolyase